MKNKILDWWNRIGYGIDELGVFFICICIILWVCSFFFGDGFFVASLIVLLIAIARMVSRNNYRRERENIAFRRIEFRVKKFFSGRASRYTIENGNTMQQNESSIVKFIKTAYYKIISRFSVRRTKDYIIYKCSCCGQRIRVPSDKGKISITCPRCKKTFIKIT